MQDETGNKHLYGKWHPDAGRLNVCLPDTGAPDIEVPDMCFTDRCSADAEGRDAFSTYMRRRLEDHRLSVDAAGWEALEAKIRQEGLLVEASPALMSRAEASPGKASLVETSLFPTSLVKEQPEEATADTEVVRDGEAICGSRYTERSTRPKGGFGRWLGWWLAAAVLAGLVWLLPFTRKERTEEEAIGESRIEEQAFAAGDAALRKTDKITGEILPSQEDRGAVKQPEKQRTSDKQRISDEQRETGERKISGNKQPDSSTEKQASPPMDRPEISEGSPGETLLPATDHLASGTVLLTPEKETSPAGRSDSKTEKAANAEGEELLLPRLHTLLVSGDSSSVSLQAPPSPPLPAPDRRSEAVRQSLAGARRGSVPGKSLPLGTPRLGKKPLRSAWLLAARMGTEGNLSVPEGGYSMDAAGPSDDGTVQVPPPFDESATVPDPPAPSWELPTNLSFANFSEADYLPPLSFGLTVRKNFSSRLGMETGLIYTYLASRFYNRGIPQEEARLQLHYLGIPFNVVVNLWEHSRWNLYFMAGGMVEKGLQAVYSHTIYKNRQVHTISGKTSVDGLQWSVNASIGVSYRFFRDWSFYLEPRFSYYFDSNQPASIRTDKPVGAGVGGGIRYAF